MKESSTEAQLSWDTPPTVNGKQAKVVVYGGDANKGVYNFTAMGTAVGSSVPVVDLAPNTMQCFQIKYLTGTGQSATASNMACVFMG